MLTRWNDFDQTIALLDAFRQQFDRFFDDYNTGASPLSASGPRVTVNENADALVLTADVPGLTEKDVSLSVNQDVFTLTGERKADAPEGYTAHRRERAAYRFSRSFALPLKVDVERATATVKDGVLTVNLPKAPEAQPRQIAVRSQ